MPCSSLGPKLFWDYPNCFGRVQIVLDTFGPIRYDLETSKIIWTRQKQFGWPKIVLCLDKAFVRFTKICTNSSDIKTLEFSEQFV